MDKQILVSLLSLALMLSTWPQVLRASQEAGAPAATTRSPTPRVQQTPEQLQQLVAPIALYPDSLVAQILAASTYPEQVVEADRWLQAHPDLKGDALGKAVDPQPWDPSVKALTGFPSVLGNMDKNLSWTSSLGDAYFNQEQDVMDAVQVMRGRAQESGNLKTTPQQTVTTQGSTIIVEPAAPDVVYVPAYDPWVVYGGPIVAWPGWYPYPGIWYEGPYLWFGVGFEIGWFGDWGWGWHHWGCDWHDHYIIHDRNRYYSRSNTFYNRNSFYRDRDERGRVSGGRGEVHGDRGAMGDRGGPGARPSNGNPGGRGDFQNRPGATARPFDGDRQAARGFGDPRGQSGVHSGAFSGYDHGGQERSFSQRGGASFGGGGFHGGGGGGFHGGGGRR
ncbi:MAG TPA: DUF3300 domain-containing protein [Candidatus Sulfotelmatobacter sp.]|nr:DUF3300 domain-containing protein [Candidatus Sulfotelmatobacter sp.]